MGAGALIGAVVGGLSSSGVFGGALAAFFGEGAILTGIMTGASLGSIFDQSATSSTYEFGSSQNTRSNRMPIPVIYGRCKVAGNVIYESRPDPVSVRNETLSNSTGDKMHYIFAHGEIFLNPAPVIKIYRSYYLYGGRVQYNETVIVDASQYLINEVGGELNFYQAQVAPAPPSGYVGSNHYITQVIKADYTYQPTTSGQIKIQVALGEGQINSVSDIRINNVPIERIANASWSIYYGSSSQTADSRNPFGETFRDLAYLSISLQANDQVSGTVTATAIVEGRIVNVWDSDAGVWIQTYSRNPVWCLLDMLTNTRYGKGISTSKINLESFKNAAPYCDALVDDGNGGQESRFLFDYNFDSIVDSSDAIEEILKTFGGMLIRADGLIQLRVEQSEAATFAFDSANIVEGSFTYQPRQRSKEIPNRIVIEFINPNNNRNAWEMDAVVIDDEWDQEQRGKIIEKKLQFRGITRASQAGRMGWLVYDKLRWCGAICQFRVGIDSIVNIVGDVVTINHILAGSVPKKFRILSMEEGENDEAVITAMLHRDDIFHDRGVVYVPVPETSLPDPFTVPDPTNLNVAESTFVNASGEIITEVKVTFDPASYYSYYANTLIQLSANGGTTWYDEGNPTDGEYRIRGLKTGSTYKIRLKTISRSGLKSAGIPATVKISGKNQPPSDVPKLIVRQTDSQLKATVTPSNDPDIKCYRLRMGWSWDNSVLIKEFDGTEYVFAAPKEGTLTFWVKAIDYSDGESRNATKAICTVFGLKPTNVIYGEDLNLSNAMPQNMYLDIWGRWRIQGVARLTDFEYFSDLFEGRPRLRPGSQLVFPEIDLGPNILEEGCFYLDMWGAMHLKSLETAYDYEYFSDVFDAFYTGFALVNPKYATQTLLGVNITYNTNSNNRIDIDYRARVDGDGWSEWTPYIERQFLGRRIMPRLTPVSIDGITDVIIRVVNVIVDVPDVEDVIENISIPAAKTRIYYRRKFFDVPKSITPFTTDETGKQATCRIDPATITRDYFEIEILDNNGNLITGILQRVTVRGF